MPSHILYGRRIQLIPYHLEDPEYLLYTSSKDLQRSVVEQNHLAQQFWQQWKRDYFQKILAAGYKKGRCGDNPDDKPRVQWKLAVVEELIEGRDGMICAAHIRMNRLKTTYPIVKLYPLEVSVLLEIKLLIFVLLLTVQKSPR